MKRPRIGLQCRFLMAMGLTLAVVAAVLAGLWWQMRLNDAAILALGRQSLHETSMEAIRGHGNELSRLAGERLVNPLYYFDLHGVGQVLDTIRRQPDVAYVRVVDGQGRLIHDGSSNFATYGEPVAGTAEGIAITAAGSVGQTGAEPADRPQAGGSQPDMLVFSQPITLGDEQLGTVVVGLSLANALAREQTAVALLEGKLADAAHEHLLAQFGLLGLLILVGLGLLLAVGRGLVWPIRRLSDAARLVEQGRYESVALNTRRTDEIGDLMRAFVHMSQSIAEQERQMREMAYSDSLTQLPNRLAFRESLEQRMKARRQNGGELALLFLDLDDFKQVNDTLGHDAGDALLVEFSERLATRVPEVAGSSALVARFGGDEFVVLIEGSELEAKAGELASALVGLLAEPFEIAGRRVVLGTSIGITLCPRDADTVGAMLKHVDIAMYQAKHAGKNAHRFFSAGMDRQVEQRVRLEQDLRGAWQRGEMSLVYQPIYRIADRAMIGVEALLRWSHPELGILLPSVFVPLAEQSGIIEALGARVLHRACVDARAWRGRDGTPLKLAINVSSRQLRDGLLVDQVGAALHESGLEPDRLHLELTETAVLADEEQASIVLSRLRSRGIEVWLDDFGTGFSGLSHLRRVPVDGLKIDRSFIADVLTDPDDLSLAAAIVAMAHARGMGVVAEGIESAEQFEVLRKLGCNSAQGYWLDPPMSAERLSERLANRPSLSVIGR